MTPLIVFGLAAIIVWSVFSDRLRRWHISGPLTMIVFGVVVGSFLTGEISNHLDTHIAERVVELILAVLLFVDATEVRGGFAAGERGMVARLLAVALPVSIILTVIVGLPLLPGVSSPWVLLAVACIVLPIDFAPAAEVLRDRAIPQRLRHGLAVESGYNDGIFSPLFAWCLLLLGLEEPGTPAEALEHAIPAAGFAVAVGVGVGAVTGALVRLSMRRGWALARGVRLGVALVPLLTYAVAVGLGGNGFVAAFVAGITFKLARFGWKDRHSDVPHGELSVVEDVGDLSALLMWFVFGSVTVFLFLTPIKWTWVVFAVLAITLLRMIPVYLAMLGSRFSWRERTALGFLGPRGTSSIVFGLLAFNTMREDDANLALTITMLTVIGSVILHGVFGRRIAHVVVRDKETAEA